MKNLELELKHTEEYSIVLYFLIALAIHLAIGYGIYLYLNSESGGKAFKAFVSQSEKKPSLQTLPDLLKKSTDAPSGSSSIPSLDPSSKAAINQEKTFIDKKSGLLFADEINIPGEKKIQPAGRKIVNPLIHREFTLASLPRQFRSRNWDLNLRVKIDRNGVPDKNIRITKSSGDKVLDQLTINRIRNSSFEPAHFEDSKEYFDYTFDMEIHYR